MNVITEDSTIYEDETLSRGLFKSEIFWMINAVIETSDVWAMRMEDTRNQLDDAGMIEKWKFELWCKAIGRKLPYE